MRSQTQKVLASAPLFEGLSPRQIAKLISYLKVETLNDGDSIFPDNNSQAANGCYIAISGKMVLQNDSNGQEEYGPGTTIGELSLLGEKMPHILAVAEDETQVAFLSTEALTKMENANPHIAAKILINLSVLLGRRFRWLNAALAALPSENSGEYKTENVDGQNPIHRDAG